MHIIQNISSGYSFDGNVDRMTANTESEGLQLTEKLTYLVEFAELEEDEGVRVELDDRPALAVFLHGGEVHVTADQCTHGPASLAEGMCDNGEIECPFHMGRFCLRTGRATATPCQEPIAVHRARLVDGAVYLVEP